jgi:hypothetical protein
MIDLQAIKPHMPVVCSEGKQFAVVDHLEGRDHIKLAKDGAGQHHYIPTGWVTSIDEAVHVNRPGDSAMREWMTAPEDMVASGIPRANEPASPDDAGRGRGERKADPEGDPERAERLARK